MADFDDDYDDAYYLDDDYVYVDDSFDLADELAENSTPEPPLIDRKEEDWDDFDSYDYWMDIEYNTDEYYDTLLQQNGQSPKQFAGKKRKVVPNTGGPVPAYKRRKVSAAQSQGIESNELREITPVIWLPFEETHSLCDVSQSYTVSSPYTLFKDWREVFKDSTGFFTASKTGRKSKLEAMSKEAGSRNEDMSGVEYEEDGNPEDDEEDDEDDGEEHDVEQDMEGEYAGADEQDEEELGFDPQQLMSVLQQKLSGSGMGAAQQAKMMETIMSTLTNGGPGGLEDMLGELTESILDQATQEGSDSGAAQWLSQQGIALDAEEEDAEEDKQDDEAHRAGAVGMDSATSSGNGLSQSSTFKSDSGAAHDDTTNADKTVLKEVQAAEKPAASSSKELKDHKVKAKQTVKAASKPVEESKDAVAAPRATRSRAAPASTVEKPTTRKRKAGGDEAAEANTKPKRQAQNFAAPTASSANKLAEPKKTTRTTRQSKK